MTYLVPHAEVCRKGTTIVFNQMLGFKIKKLQFQMSEEGVAQENSRIPKQEKQKWSF
jgi:hypothetical protein